MSTLSVDTIQGKTTAGTVAMPSGTPVQLQVTQGNFSYQELTTQSMVEVSDMNVTITPKFASSKILLTIQTVWWCATDANNYLITTIYRSIGGGSFSNLAVDNTYDAIRFHAPAKTATWTNECNLGYIDTPNTTSQIVYKFYARRYDATNAVRLKYAQTSSFMKAMEVVQ